MEQLVASPQEEPFATEAGSASAHLPPGHPSRRWQLFDRLVIVAFVLGLLVPAATLAIGLRSSRIENRPLLTLPRVAFESLEDGTWTAGVDAFLANNLVLRPIAVRLRGELEWLSGGTGNPNVLRGRDGWLFFAGELAPDCKFSADDQLTALRDGSRRLEAAGQDVHLLVAPDKHAVYPDKVGSNPFPPSCADLARASLVAGFATTSSAAIDGLAVLEAARAADPSGPALYYPLDSHWSPSGAIVAIRALVTAIDPGLWRDEDVVRDGRAKLRADLARQMGIRRTGTVPQVTVRPGTVVARTDVAVPISVSNARAVFRTTATGDAPVVPGRTVIIYDSFFGIDVPLVAPFFADATWIHVGDIIQHPELGALTGPFDHVIVERVARGFYETDLEAILSALVR